MPELSQKDRKNVVSEIGKRLLKIRKQLGYSRYEMGVRLGIGEAAYGKNETGINFPGLKSLRILQQTLNISLDWLLFEKGPMNYQTKIEEAKMVEKQEQIKNEEEKLKNEEERLKEEEERLKNEEQKVKKMADDAVKFLRLQTKMPDITELLEYMEEDPELRYKVLLDFYSYKKGKEGE
ncbi:MAG: helix-turn-helix transcriptional regulator [bacterium]|nr:helix-turn-helix transcriptional regulator [bacterium]